MKNIVNFLEGTATSVAAQGDLAGRSEEEEEETEN